MLLAAWVYSYTKDAPIRQLNAVCASLRVGADANNLRNWAIENGADPETTRWEDAKLTISFRTSPSRYPAYCDVQTQDGKIKSISTASIH